MTMMAPRRELRVGPSTQDEERGLEVAELVSGDLDAGIPLGGIPESASEPMGVSEPSEGSGEEVGSERVLLQVRLELGPEPTGAVRGGKGCLPVNSLLS